MHDHQSDWKSIYSDLGDMDSVDNLNDPLMGEESTRPLINSQQLNHAKSVFRQMKQQAFKALDKIPNQKPKGKRVVQMKISDLLTRAEINLQDLDYSSQITNLIHKTKIQLHRIIVINKFASQINSIIAEFKDGLLTKDQQDAAASEMKAINNYTRQDLTKAQTMASLHDAYVSGKNSVNGALVKYVADSQINIGDQLKVVADKIHQNIGAQPNLNIAAKYLAYQRIDTIKTSLMADLMSAGDFASLKRVKRHGLSQFKSILNDKNKILENLTIFNKFVAKVRKMIAGFSHLSTSAELQLEQRIDNYQKDVETQVQQLHHNAHESDFNFKEHYLATMVIKTIVDSCQRMLSNQKMKMTSAQQESLNDELQSIAMKINDDFDQSHLKDSIEDTLAAGVKQLQSVTKKINTVIYRNQVHQFVDDIHSRIDQLYELSANNRTRLQTRIKMIGQHLLKDRSDLQSSVAKDQLYGAFRKQSQYMIQASIHKVFNSLYKQIQASHLSLNQTHHFLSQLIKIRRKTDVDYESKQLLIKNVLNQSLVVDKNENLQRMTKLNEDLHHQINSVDIASQLDSVLREDLIDFSQRINDAETLSVADREEQQFESLAYRKLYHLYAGTDSPQADALRTAITQADRIHHQVNAAVLDPQVNWIINERISKDTNSSLYRLLSIHDPEMLKKYVVKLVKKVKAEIPQAISRLKKIYLDQMDQFFKKISYQLKAYSVVWGVLDKVNLIQVNTVKRIRRADNLLKIEYAKQWGYQQANALVSKVVSHSNHGRQHANQQIDALIQSIGIRLKHIKLDIKHVDYAFLNRILRIENLAKYHVNQCLDSDLADNCRYYGRLLGRILRQSYLREWLINIKRAYVMVKNLDNVPTGAKLRVLQSIQDLKLKTTAKLRKCDQSDLPKVLKTSDNKVRKLITHSIYLDPVKKRARQNLMNLVRQIRSQVKNSFDDKTAKKLRAQIDQMSRNIDDQLRLNNDQKVKQIYNAKFKELKTYELKLTRKIELNHYIKCTRKFSKRLDAMKMLADREVQRSNEVFNRYYHKAIYKVSHAANLAECQRNERESRAAIDKILDKDQTINDSKQKFYKAVNAKIKQAKQQILSLKNLQKKDKHDSNKLLDQIQRQTYRNVKQALSRNQMLDAETKSNKLVKQVINKVSSASVLVAAIKSANNQISQSTLDKKQKSATLKQINQIIDQGIKSQFNENKKSSRIHSSRHFHHHDHGGNQLDDFDLNLDDSKAHKSRNQSNSIIGSIINVFKNFFRWLRVKLAQAF